MPWQSFQIEDEYCVFQIDDDGNRTGESLGCHETKALADDQVAALNIAEDEDSQARNLFDKFWQGLKSIFVSRDERAISSQMVFDSLWSKMFELDTEIEGSDHWLVDIFFDDDSFYALYVDRGKLFRYDIIIDNNDVALGERVEVMEVHQPVESRTVIRQQEDGQFRWFSISGTAVLNRSGEIDSRELFDSFIQHAESTGEYPIRQFYHSGESYRTGQVDFLARDEYCYITSGLYDDTQIAEVEIQARQNNPKFWGDSIGFIPTEERELAEIANGIKIPVYKQGINREISTLPETEAAHLFTNRTEVQMSLDTRARDAWLKMWQDAGYNEEDALKWLADNPQARNRAIEQDGLIARNQEEETEEEVVVETEEIEETGEFEIDDSVIEAVGQTVLESEAITELSTRLETIETRFEERAKADKDLVTAIENLTERLNTLEKREAAVQQQVEDDRPAKFNGKTRVVYRPRQANAALQENGVAYSEKAQGNLADKLGGKVY